MIKIVNQMINNERPSFAFKNVKPAKSHGYNLAPIWITPTPLKRLEPSANQIITKSSIIRLHRPFPRKGKTAQVEGKNTRTFDNIPHTVKKWSPVSIAAPKNMEQTFFSMVSIKLPCLPGHFTWSRDPHREPQWPLLFEGERAAEKRRVRSIDGGF